jgi:hypothetical protein
MRRSIKSILVILIAFVLLYYSVAWAVLRCAHEEYDSSQDVAPLGYTPSAPIPLNFDCGGPNYHTELLAASLCLSQLERLTAAIVFRVNAFLTLRTFSRSGEGDLWLRAVFESPSALSFLTGLPRYLSISVLRV